MSEEVSFCLSWIFFFGGGGVLPFLFCFLTRTLQGLEILFSGGQSAPPRFNLKTLETVIVDSSHSLHEPVFLSYLHSFPPAKNKKYETFQTKISTNISFWYLAVNFQENPIYFGLSEVISGFCELVYTKNFW